MHTGTVQINAHSTTSDVDTLTSTPTPLDASQLTIVSRSSLLAFRMVSVLVTLLFSDVNVSVLDRENSDPFITVLLPKVQVTLGGGVPVTSQTTDTDPNSLTVTFGVALSLSVASGITTRTCEEHKTHPQ